MSKLRFTVAGEGSSGRPAGHFSRNWTAEEELDRITEAVEAGQLSNQQALEAALHLQQSPDNLELSNFIAGCYWRAELRQEAGELWEGTLAHAMQLIPSGFKGEIHWLEIDNRPFLRVAHGALLSRMDREDAKGAGALCRQLLKWCPSDNLGVRMLQGDIAFLAGNYQRALKHYVAHGHEEPGSWYQAGRIAFRSGNFVEACTFVRRGIIANPYIAEGITGRTILNDHLYWHGTNKAAAEWAVDYLSDPRGEWNEWEADFIDWVFNSAAVLKERATIAELREGLTYTEPGSERSAIVSRMLSFEAAVSEDVSQAMVHKARNRWGMEYWPWERDGDRRRPVKQLNS